MTTIQKTQFTFDRIYGKLLDSEILGYTFYLQKNAEADTIGWREFKAKGKTYLILCAAPTFTNGKVDFENGAPVEDWDFTQLDNEQLTELFEIQARLYDAFNQSGWDEDI
tara:strand:- start:82 stop:411 length:330 start_codon:yes stop_codon:yes gene_type:complete